MKFKKLQESNNNIPDPEGYATLLTAKEAEKLPQELLEYPYGWWLRTPGVLPRCSNCVDEEGDLLIHCDVDSDGDYLVRPALKIQNLNQPVGTKFQFGGQIFEVIDDVTAFCTEDLGFSYFNKTRNQGNKYDTSDIKKFVDDWFEKSWREAF